MKRAFLIILILTSNQLIFSQNINEWEFKTFKCSDCIINTTDKNKKESSKKFIKISKRKIIFYKNKISKKNIIRIEKIKFTEQFDYFSNLKSFVFSDKTIWNLEVDKSNKILRISRSGKEKENGRNRLISGITREYYARKK